MPHLRLRAFVSAVAVAAILSRHFFSLHIDSITIALLLLGFLPWLAPLIKSIEIPGVGKIEMQEVKAKAEEAKGAAESAVRKVEFALANTAQKQSGVSPSDTSAGAVQAEWKSLTDEYSRLRDIMPESPVRTSIMTQTISKMIRLAPLVPEYDVSSHLQQKGPGDRLGAYAFLYVRPDPTYFFEVVDALADIEDKKFNQYWGIL